MGAYAELHARSNFSFLDGASHPEELARQAAALGFILLVAPLLAWQVARHIDTPAVVLVAASDVRSGPGSRAGCARSWPRRR